MRLATLRIALWIVNAAHGPSLRLAQRHAEAKILMTTPLLELVLAPPATNMVVAALLLKRF